MQSIKSLKEVSLQHKIEDVIEFLKEKRLLHSSRTCSNGHSMKFEARKDISDKYRWRCSKCNESSSIRANTFFEHFKISLMLICNLITHWALETRQIDQKNLLDVGLTTIRHVQQKLRLITCKLHDKENFILGKKILINLYLYFN